MSREFVIRGSFEKIRKYIPIMEIAGGQLRFHESGWDITYRTADIHAVLYRESDEYVIHGIVYNTATTDPVAVILMQ